MSAVIDIKGLDKAALLAGLYNRSKLEGADILYFILAPMRLDEARKILDQNQTADKSFDYLKGRHMKISLKGDHLATELYNQENGPGAAEEVVDAVRAGSRTVSDEKPVNGNARWETRVENKDNSERARIVTPVR